MTRGKESLIRRWAHASWHSWLKSEPEWTVIFAELWMRLPEEALESVLTSVRPLIVLPPVEAGRVVRIRGPLLAGARILQLDSRLLSRSVDETLAILAHELAHLCAPVINDELANDLEADRLVVSWGLGAGLLKALKRDLDHDHPRVIAAASGAAPRMSA